MDQIEHFSHEHPLIFYEESNERLKQAINALEETYGIPAKPEQILPCDGCSQPINGSPAYFCETCLSFSLHKSCTTLPQHLDHPLHSTDHPLTLIQSSSDMLFVCELCRDLCNGFSYHCDQCQFDLEIKCALSTHGHNADPALKLRLDHFSHEHTLKLCNPFQPANYLCRLCGESLSTSEMSYGCFGCQFYLHMSCAEIPREIHHPQHLEHPLCAQSQTKFVWNGSRPCVACESRIEFGEMFYQCATCPYDLHCRCAIKSLNPSDPTEATKPDEEE